MPRNILRFFVQRFFRRNRLEDDLQTELASHLSFETQERIGRGETPESAHASVMREFGNVALVGEVTRDMWGFCWLEEAIQDSRYAIRMLRKSLGLSLTVMLMLALGIGGASAIFTFVDGILLRPLSFPNPKQLVTIWEIPPEIKHPNVVALNNFIVWKQRSRSFQSMAAFFNIPMNLLAPRGGEQVPGSAVTSEFFTTLGTPPMLGRTFRPGEYDRNEPKEAVLSYENWQSRFGGRADVIGKKISINVSHHEIIGVMPPGFGIPNVDAEVYVPLGITLDEGRNYSVVARLKPGVSVGAANGEMASIAAHTAKESPELDAGWSASVIPLLDHAVGPVRPVLLVLFAAVALVLLLACVNIANLLLMHSAARTREMSVRLALGASRGRIVRQLLVENLLLAAVGGIAGILLAFASVDLIRNGLPQSLHIPRLQEISVNAGVLAFSIVITVCSSVLFGLAPTLQVLKRDLIRDLHSVTRSITSGGNLRNVLVVSEVALAVIVVMAAGLMVRSFNRLLNVDSGFHAEHVLTLRMMLLPVQKEQFHAEAVDEMLTRIRSLPGVISAGSIGILPMEGGNSGTWYYRADQPEPAANKRPAGDVSIITPGYFRTLGIPILRGRDFDQHDGSGSMRVAILNESAARIFFPREDPMGKRMKVWWNNSPVVTIVGIARDIRQSQLTTPPDPCLFMPNDQAPFPFTALVVRSAGDPRALIPAVREQIREVDSDQGISKINTMTEMVAGSIARQRVETILLSTFGSVALLLACVGVYGVIAYSVAQRSREIGIRLALGATLVVVFRNVIAGGFRLTMVGLLIGLSGALVLTRYLRSLLFEVQPSDPVTLVGVAGLIAVVSLVACYWPAHRATKMDPAAILHQE